MFAKRRLTWNKHWPTASLADMPDDRFVIRDITGQRMAGSYLITTDATHSSMGAISRTNSAESTRLLQDF